MKSPWQLAQFKKSYLVSESEPTISTTELCDRLINKINEDPNNKISVHELMKELMALDQKINDFSTSKNERENLMQIRKILIEPLFEYGKENQEFLEEFTLAEKEQEEYRKLYLDTDIITFMEICAKHGPEQVVDHAKKMMQTKEGREKLEKIIGQAPNGKSLLKDIQTIK